MTQMHATVPFSKSPAKRPPYAGRQPSLAEQLLAKTLSDEVLRPPVNAALVGRCVAPSAESPAEGRYPVRYRRGDAPACTAHLLALAGVEPMPGDRVLLVEPDNLAEPVIVGVLGREKYAGKTHGANLSLAPDQPLAITCPKGQPLLEIQLADQGIVVRLLQSDVTIDMPGSLEFSAETIAMSARSGDVCIESESDVVVRGTTIRLN